MVPNGWSDNRVKDVVKSLDAGVSVNSEDDKDLSADFKILKTSCVSKGVFSANEVKTVNEDIEIERLKEPVLSNSIIISRMNTPLLVGANAYVEAAPENTFLPDRLWQVKPKSSKVNMRWLGYWFASSHTRYTLSSNATGTSGSMKNITKPDVMSMRLLLPPLPEQRKVAQILSTWDRGIATTEKLIDASKQQKKALMQQLLTGKNRLIDPETGKAFEGDWEEVTFDHALSKLTDYTANGSFAALADNVSVYNESNYALWIMGRSLKSGDFVKDVRYTDKHGYDFLKKTKLFGGELLMPKTGDVGKAYLFPKLDQKATLADNVFLLDFKDFIINEYARYYINSEYFQFELERTMYGTSQKTIVKKSLRKMKIILPSILEQNLIVTVLDKADKEIELLEAKLAHFKQEKKALMQQLLTGKRRVSLSS